MTQRPEPIVVGLFQDRFAAEKAVSDLHAAGFTEEDIGYAIRGSEAVSGGTITDAGLTKDAEGAKRGMVAGGIAGSVFGALAALALPGVGPVLAGGIIASALGFGAAGAATGGILGAMTGLGISENEARIYEKELVAGKGIVTVRPGKKESEARSILRRNGAYNIKDEAIDPLHSVKP